MITHCASDGCNDFFLGTHNSYHISPSWGTLNALKLAGKVSTAESLSYTFPTLEEQFGLGLASFEIDVLADPDGGRFASPGIAKTLFLEELPSHFDAEMSAPGFKVLHTQDIDVQSHCLTLHSCITKLLAVPRTDVMYVLLEIKDDTPSFPAFSPIQPVEALPMTDALWEALEREVAAGRAASPPIHFLLDSKANSAAYIRYLSTKAASTKVLMPSIEGMAALPSGWNTSEVYAKCNDAREPACALGLNVQQLVEQGYLVRARSDVFPTWDEARARATLASGAQIIHTDYIHKVFALMGISVDVAEPDDANRRFAEQSIVAALVAVAVVAMVAAQCLLLRRLLRRLARLTRSGQSVLYTTPRPLCLIPLPWLSH